MLCIFINYYVCMLLCILFCVCVCILHFVYFLCVLTNFEVRLVSGEANTREHLRVIEGESLLPSAKVRDYF